jgi:hypothetical protein
MTNETENVAAHKEPTTAQKVGVCAAGEVSITVEGRSRSGTYQIMKQTVMESVQAGMNQTACAGFPRLVAI